MSLTFRKAVADEAESVAALINSAYRGERSRLGWTTEAHLLDGLRTDTADIRQLIARRDSIILLCEHAEAIIGSVHIEKAGGDANLGMFVVDPTRQGQGVGKHLLSRAEETARTEWQVDKIVLHVITLRHELIAFYGRRGYRRTGVLHEFPVNPALWTLKVDGLALEVLEKRVGLGVRPEP
ncbi:GNAT family N-acetyltransferase [Methylococcus sp. EFPC2]|uniref:GNAT family N-acetyltransferase n=1 Tax=Methylococcus sp. EFPC2 TaxID=2812648 RepID=UPI00196826EF|nr:GNAT family N-acetyltransferase [Methylococcus sp. EFPC2]QSA97083.1 GNAT family N-acetyltransferase [Methylococcus sp. EFPC2]